MSDILFFSAVTPADADWVGGKTLGLAVGTAAGLPVPPGFVVTTSAFRRLFRAGLQSDPTFHAELADAYTRLGGGPVAVRSSATAEDAADASSAGQQETILGVTGFDAVCQAVERCWQSLFTDRAVAYRARQGIDEAGLAMAVVVQSLVPADAAGVLFTADPGDATGSTMLVEASWGLGETVVSGRVTPDRFRLNRTTGDVVERHLGSKSVRVGTAGEVAVPPADQERFCLTDHELVGLAYLGRRVEAAFGGPRDVEWAVAGGTLYMLQARPITVATAADRERARAEVVAGLKRLAGDIPTVWVQYNLSEVLPTPTPLTWAVVQRLLAADGGFGAMNRDLGTSPDPALGSQGGFDLVAGRPMANLARLPRMQFARPPFRYPVERYRTDPTKALTPTPVLDPLAGRGCFLGVLSLPGTILRLWRMSSATRRQAVGYPAHFASLSRAFAVAARQAMAQDWSRLDPPALAREFDTWTNRTLVEFARESLKATVFADAAWATVVAKLTPALGADRAKAVTAELTLGAAPPADAHLAAGLADLAAGALTPAAFVEQFGHRGADEMELGQPRWAESPAEVERLRTIPRTRTLPPDAGSAFDRLKGVATLDKEVTDRLRKRVDELRTYLGLREAAKHYLLMGYAVIRRAAVQLDSRFRLNGGVFFLTPADFPDLLAGKDVSARIAAARTRRQAELSLTVPPVLFSDDLDAVGRPLPEPVGGDTFTGTPLSAGVADGLALVLLEPTTPPAEGGYVLVCPSTDPAWVPLFARAAAVVLETGGVLSHGAIVAREFGLPAVAGLPGVTTRVHSGQRLRVDGGTGRVTILNGP